MLRRLAGYVRQQHLALFALFVALGGSAYAAATIDSSQVVDNSLTGADVAGRPASPGKPFTEGTPTGADIRGSVRPGHPVVPGSLTGADIAQSTLTALATSNGTSRQATYQCDASGNNECAKVTLTVPAGRTFRAVVLSSLTAKLVTYVGSVQINYCPAVKSSNGTALRCLTPHKYADSIPLTAGQQGSGSATADTRTAGVALTGPATWTFSTLMTVTPADSLWAGPDLNAHTTVLVTDARAPAAPNLGTIDCGAIGTQSSGSSSGGPIYPNDPCGS